MPTATKAESRSSGRNRLTNYMEELTGNILEDLLDKEKFGNISDRAIEDIKALALNRLWPMYTTTANGKDFLRKTVVEDQIEKDIVRELKVAINIVRSNPR